VTTVDVVVTVGGVGSVAVCVSSGLCLAAERRVEARGTGAFQRHEICSARRCVAMGCACVVVTGRSCEVEEGRDKVKGH